MYWNQDNFEVYVDGTVGMYPCANFKIDFMQRNNDGFTALHYAAYHGYEAVVFLLLDAGAGTECCMYGYFVWFMVMEKFSALYFNFWLLCTICCHRSSNFLRYSAQTLFYSLECNKCRQSHSCPAVHYCRSTTWLAINYILVQNNKSTFHLLPFPCISFAFFPPLLSFFISFHFYFYFYQMSSC